MKIALYDTLSAMRAIIAAPISERHTVYRECLIEPLRDYWTMTFSRFAPQMIDDEATIRNTLSA